jgi:hypothetical protein
MVELAKDSNLRIRTDEDEILIQINLNGVPDEGWPRVYNRLAHEENLPAAVFGLEPYWELELRFLPYDGTDHVAPILSKAVDLLARADGEHAREATEVRQIEVAARAWYNDFTRGDTG